MEQMIDSILKEHCHQRYLNSADRYITKKQMPYLFAELKRNGSKVVGKYRVWATLDECIGVTKA